MKHVLRLVLATIIVLGLFGTSAEAASQGDKTPATQSPSITRFEGRGTVIPKTGVQPAYVSPGETCYFYNGYVEDSRYRPAFGIEWCGYNGVVTHTNVHYCYNSGQMSPGWNYNGCSSQPGPFTSLNAKGSTSFFENYSYSCCGPFQWYSRQPYVGNGRIYWDGWISGEWYW
jgi:hypothetical protein